MASLNEKPILDGLNLKDITSIHRFIASLKKTLDIIPTKTTHRERNQPTQAERLEAKRCYDLMESNPLLTAIVNRFLENSERDDECVLASADWLNRTATKDTFIVNSEAYEKVRRAWVEANEHGDTLTSHLPELKLTAFEMDNSAGKESSKAVVTKKEPDLQPPGLPVLEGTGAKEVAELNPAVKRERGESLAADQQIHEIGVSVRDLEELLENTEPGPDFNSKLRDLVQAAKASARGTSSSSKLQKRGPGFTKAGNPRPKPAAAKRRPGRPRKSVAPNPESQEDVRGNRQEGQMAGGGGVKYKNGNGEGGSYAVGGALVREETPEYAKGPQIEQILAKGWQVPDHSLTGEPTWCYQIKWKNIMGAKWESIANIRDQFGGELSLFENSLDMRSPHGPASRASEN